ncbi:MAG: endolytic transglycosylase MltG [Steroidobacteraceae bacterium]|jgi:UPF0755 protein|nr:endolytic transglycosylase MltG [Steroidobacteraceae bacterium]
MARGALIRWALLAALAGALAVAGGWLGLRWLDDRRMAAPVEGLQAPAVFVIERGTSLRGVVRVLENAGLLEHPGSFSRSAVRSGVAASLKAGEYEARPGVTPAELLGMLAEGRVLLHPLTLVEGWTALQALAAVQAHPAIDVRIPAGDMAALATSLGLGGRSAEGMLFPDTYLFPRGTPDEALLRQAKQRLEAVLAQSWESRQPGLPLAEPYQALILASIVEKETGAPDERPLIAGVFVNRLRIGMRLQTDPTVIYGLGAAFDGNLRRADLQRDTEYNTYTRAGLPPTPIALAGRAAIEAATRPADTEALYFVATGLGDGRHRFARTLAEHNANVSRYILALREARSGGSQ